MELTGKRVLLTGASRGLGAGLAAAFVEAGAQVVGVARVAPPGGIAGDLTDEEFVSSLVPSVLGDGPIDVLVNNAGVAPVAALSEQSEEQIRSVFRVNLEVPALLCRAVLPSMLQRRSGHIVNISSLAMAVDTPGWSGYGASKAGLSSLSESLRLELNGTGVGLTLVEIGEVDTDMLHEIRRTEHVDEVFTRSEKLRLQRLLSVSEVAAAVRRGVESDAAHVRLPRRAAAFPMIVNIPRRISRILSP